MSLLDNPINQCIQKKLGHACAPIRIFCSQCPMIIHQSKWIRWPIVHILTMWGSMTSDDQQMTDDQIFVEVACVPTANILLLKCQIYQSIWEQWVILLALTFLAPPTYNNTNVCTLSTQFMVPFLPNDRDNNTVIIISIFHAEMSHRHDNSSPVRDMSNVEAITDLQGDHKTKT